MKLKTHILMIFFGTLLMYSGCAQDKDALVVIKTPYGDMTAILYDDTPKHKANFLKLAKEKFYDSLLFHRVISGFMIQGGDPNSKNAKSSESLGNGGPGYTIDAEIVSKHYHMNGALSAARLGDQQNPSKASSGSQFYIVQGTVLPPEQMENFRLNPNNLNLAFSRFFADPNNKALSDSLNSVYQKGDMMAYQKAIQGLIPRVEKETGVVIQKNIPQERIDAYAKVGGAPHLDDEYTVFGQVIRGLEVIDKIAAVERGAMDRPLQDVPMQVTVVEMSRKKIAKEYGYVYPAEK